MEKLLKICESKTNTNSNVLLVKSFLAGIFIALGGLGSQVINELTDTSYMGAFIFPIGLIMVVCTGSELFTGNCLMVAAVVDERISTKKLIKSWGIVYVGNFIGSLFVAFMVMFGKIHHMNDGSLGELMSDMAATKSGISIGVGLSKGILCNILVCVAVYMAIQAESLAAKIIAAYFPVVLFVLCGFEHSVANMYFIILGQMIGGTDAMGIVFNLIPVTVGNILGGILIAITLYDGSKK